MVGEEVQVSGDPDQRVPRHRPDVRAGGLGPADFGRLNRSVSWSVNVSGRFRSPRRIGSSPRKSSFAQSSGARSTVLRITGPVQSVSLRAGSSRTLRRIVFDEPVSFGDVAVAESPWISMRTRP